MIIIYDGHADLWRAVARLAKDDSEDTEECHRQYERKDERATIAAKRAETGATMLRSSRRTLPVSWRNTDSRFGRRNTTSITSSPTALAASSSEAISVGCATEKCATSPSNVPPFWLVHSGAFSEASLIRINTSLRPPNDRCTNSSRVPSAMTLPWSMIAMRSHNRSASSM